MSPAFAALVRKERLFLVLYSLGAFASGVLSIYDRGFERLFVLGSSFESLGATQGFLALLAGAWMGLREEATRTEEFLRQRPLAPEAPVLARGWTGALISLLVPLAAGGLCYAYDLLLGGGGVGVRSEAWLGLGRASAAAFACFGVSFLAGSLPLGWPARGFALLVLFVAQILVQSWLGSLSRGLPWILALLAFGAALLLTARIAARRARDLDRPPAAALLHGPLVVLGLAALLFGSVATSGWQKLASGELAETRPWIGWTSDGRLVRCKYVGKPGSLAIVDEGGRATGEELDDDRPRVWPWRYSLHGFKTFPGDVTSTYNVPSEGNTSRAVVIDARGVRCIESESWTGRRRSVELLGEGVLAPDSVQEFKPRSADAPLFLFSSGTELWQLHPEGPSLVRVALPDDARPTGTTYYFGPVEDGTALDTTDGAFFYRDGQWVRPAPSLYRQPRLESAALDADPLTPVQRVTGPGGVTLDVAHPLDTAGKKLLAGWMGLSSVLRPLPLALVSATLDYEGMAVAHPAEFLVLFDPVLGGGYAWLVLPNALFHAWLAWLVSRELARRGLDPARRRRWALAYLAAGIWIAAWCGALETRRAWKKSRSGPAPAPLVRAA